MHGVSNPNQIVIGFDTSFQTKVLPYAWGHSLPLSPRAEDQGWVPFIAGAAILGSSWAIVRSKSH